KIFYPPNLISTATVSCIPSSKTAPESRLTPVAAPGPFRRRRRAQRWNPWTVLHHAGGGHAPSSSSPAVTSSSTPRRRPRPSAPSSPAATRRKPWPLLSHAGWDASSSSPPPSRGTAGRPERPLQCHLRTMDLPSPSLRLRQTIEEEEDSILIRYLIVEDKPNYELLDDDKLRNRTRGAFVAAHHKLRNRTLHIHFKRTSSSTTGCVMAQPSCNRSVINLSILCVCCIFPVYEFPINL
ncbi:unnamed protein product, partial [Urochloa humidicola]